MSDPFALKQESVWFVGVVLCVYNRSNASYEIIGFFHLINKIHLNHLL